MSIDLEIKRTLEQSFKDARVEVMDLTGTADHFEALVVTPDFEGLSRVQQHQKVYRALEKAMDEVIHALVLKTYSPTEYARAHGGQGAAPGRLPIIKGP